MNTQGIMGKMGDTWRGVETITRTGETDQHVTCFEFAPNTLYSGQNVNFLATFFSVLLSCFLFKQDAYFGMFFILYRLPSFHSVNQVSIVE